MFIPVNKTVTPRFNTDFVRWGKRGVTVLFTGINVRFAAILLFIDFSLIPAFFVLW